MLSEGAIRGRGMIQKWARLTHPEAEPITLDQAKDHLRIESDFTLDDDLITAYISAARDRCEKFCNRSWSESSFYAVFSDFPAWFPFPDVSSITSVSYIDGSGAEQVISASDYSFDAARQRFAPAGAWPTGAGSVMVTFEAGPDPVNVLPAGVLHAMKLYIADMYEYRVAQGTNEFKENPAAEAMLTPYRVEMGV